MGSHAQAIAAPPLHAGCRVAVSIRAIQGRRSGEGEPAFYMVLTTLAVVIAFVASTYYWRMSAARTGAQALEMATTATVAIKHLNAAQGELAKLQANTATALGGKPIDRDSAASILAALRSDLNAYRRVPFFPGEFELRRTCSTCKLGRA